MSLTNLNPVTPKFILFRYVDFIPYQKSNKRITWDVSISEKVAAMQTTNLKSDKHESRVSRKQHLAQIRTFLLSLPYLYSPDDYSKLISIQQHKNNSEVQIQADIIMHANVRGWTDRCQFHAHVRCRTIRSQIRLPS